MLPIVANIVASDASNKKQHSAKRGFKLTSMYGLGVATAYGMLGAVVSLFGQQVNIIGLMQQPWILVTFAAIFVVLGLYMLDVITLRLPTAISQKLHGLSQKGQSGLGTSLGSYVAGFFSAIVVSPCVTAPMVGALAGVASVGEPLFGFVALFALGVGLSIPLVIFGTTEGKFLPDAGEWMNWIKHGFALMLFGVAIMLLARLSDASWVLLLWGVLTAAAAFWFWQWQGRWKGFTRLCALVCGLWAGLQLVGAAMGNTDPLKPLANLSQPSSATDVIASNSVNNKSANTVEAVTPKIITEKIHTLSELDTLVANEPKLIVDVWASWCIECKHMDADLFQSPPEDMGGWTLVKLDITDVTDDSKAVMEKLNLFGPPALALYKDGELVSLRHGVTKRAEFIDILKVLNAR